MKLLKKLPANIFMVTMLLSCVVFVFRAYNMLSFPGMAIGSVSAVMPAKAQQQVDDQPPPLDKAALQKAVNDTAAAANALDGPGSIQPPAAPAAKDGAPADPLAGDMENRSFSAAEIEVLQSLAKRRDEIDAREKKLDAREALLTAAEQEVDKKVAELNQLRTELEGLLGKQKDMEAESIASLVKIYENMKPKDAAAIFNTLDMDVLLNVISHMSERKSSPVIAAMNTDKARMVTIRLAEMRKLPGSDAKPAQPGAQGR
jgi:flagellar motility protein MotE (MotC chaperone)